MTQSDFGSSRPFRAATLFVALFLTISLGACGSDDEASAQADESELTYQMGDPIDDPAIAAIVTSDYGSDTLAADEFRDRFDRIAAQVPQIQNDADQARELRKNIVEDFVLRHALFGEADQIGLNADTAAVNERLEQVKGQFPNEEAYEQALASDDLSEEELRTNITDMLRQEQMFERFSEDVVEPSEQEVTEFRESRAEQVRASHILFLVPQGADEQRRDSIRQVAESVLDSVEAGTEFAELARRHSDDGTAQMGGDLGFFSRGQMVEPFEEAVYALPDSGAVTDDLVETQYGFHIIQLTGRRTAELMDTTQARQLMLRDRQREAIEGEIETLREKVTVRLNPQVVQADLNASEVE